MPTALELLRERFGFDHFRPGQEDVVTHLLAGRSAAAVFPTGSGKSLCYQLPALLLPGLTLVVSPLLALMKEQIDRLQKLQIAAARLDSTLTLEETASVTGRLRAGELRLLYVAPERFNNERFREALKGVRVSLFAVDEAHCISEWGHNFRPDYLKLARFSERCRAECRLALTATATPQVLADICRGFAIDPACAVRTGFYRPNLTVLTTPIRAAERDAVIEDRLRGRPAGPTIIYVTLQRTAEEVAGRLAKSGFQARAYHAGMDDAERVAVHEWFAASERAVVVATIAFGMGIDKANIRAVYHYNLPKSLENFAQEIGRAGRDRLPAVCEMYACPDDLNQLENFVYGDTPSFKAVRGVVGTVFAQGAAFDVNVVSLANDHDMKALMAGTLLTYLELDGYLEVGTPFYGGYDFKPRTTSAEMLKRFEGERRAFLEKLFRLSEKAKIWFRVDLDRAAEGTGSPRERVVRALDYLAEQGMLEVKTRDLRNRYRRLKTPPDVDALARELHRRALDREAREIARLNQVVELVGHDGCQVSRLGEHFGEPLVQPCGHCSWCSRRKATPMAARPKMEIDPALWKRVQALRQEIPDPRTLARLLCGLSSPRLRGKKTKENPLFGALAHVPFAEVLRRAEG
jgi:ATP-dependent DNA helicase RecQ